MKFFFDARFIRTDFHDGISRYSASLGCALAELTPVTFLICDEAQRKYLPKNAHCLYIHRPTSIHEPFTPQILNGFHPDIVFSPMQTMGSIGRKYKLILTLHDMIYYKHRRPPENLSLPLRVGWRAFHTTYFPQRVVLNQADIVATVSETSKKEFLATHLTKRPIIVLPNAPQDLSLYVKKTRKRHDKPPQNLVYMGSFMAYKNVETLIRAMEFLPGRTLHLLSRISSRRRHELRQLIPDQAKVIFHGGVSDKKYVELLTDNAVMVSASLSEGYGLPLVEALKLGVPAVVSDLPIFHEVGGKGVLYANATSPQDFAKTIQQIDQATKREKLIAAGADHITRFNWNETARSLLRASEQLILK